MKLGCLNERAVMCKGWRWLPGMLTMDGVRIYAVEGEFFDGFDDDSEYNDHPVAALEWPDLTDPATVGCLLALVREALNVPTAHVLPSFGAWYIERDAQDGSEDSEWLHVDGVWGCGSAAIIEAKAEAEALVAALEAAP